MNGPTRIAAFALGLIAVFAAAVGVGRAVGPVAAEPAADHEGMSSESSGDMSGHAEMAAAEELPGGLMVSENGYRLVPGRIDYPAGDAVPVTFTISGPDGKPVTAFDEEHEKDLHLIVVRRDLTGFQHVHPRLDADTGRWQVDLAFTPGTWRLFADFKPTGGEAVTLGVDVAVAGDYRPAPPPAESRTATVAGYEVSLDGDLVPGADANLTARVTRDGKPVTDLQPYLGAYGHLVALRAGDLAYLHVHPNGEPGDGSTPSGPEVSFTTAVPSAADYRLFFDFQHRGRVYTASFPVSAGGTGEQPAEPQAEQPSADSHIH